MVSDTGEREAVARHDALSMHASALDTMSLAFNYHAWILDTILPFIGSRVVEVGGGIGSIAHALQDRERLVVLDNDPACCRRLQYRFDAESIRVIEGDILDPGVVAALATERLTTVVCVNVLEHITEDKRALKSMYDLLQPGGHLVLLVPALPLIYGTLDTELGHVRRYRRRALRDMITAVGFSVERCRFFNSIGAISWFAVGRVRRQQVIHSGQIRFYDRFLVPVLSRVERMIPPPFGQSLVIIARK
ncbi:MAG: class I SAM-dependent methyltransferase [Thermomicrobiales bacterium]